VKLPFCVACLAKEDLQHHHLVTRKEGGKDDETNLITLCVSCHDKLHERQIAGTYDHSRNIKAGLRRAVAEGKELGRPRIAPELEERIKKALAAPGRPSVRELAKRFGVAVNTVQRISRPFEVSTARADA
jgi:ribosome-binding protein aMBF1 (putative translation factor)